MIFRMATAAVGVLICLAACGKPVAAPAPQAASPSPSPSQSPRVPDLPRGGDQTVTLDWAGGVRIAIVHAPPTYRPGMPMVVALHYRGADPDVMRRMTGLDAKADREGFVVVYPEGVKGAFNALVCCGELDDVGFVRALIGHMTDTWQIDRRRVFLTGISNGADMSFRMAVEASDLIAAIAPVSGGFIGSKPDDPQYAAQTPVSVVTFMGSLDRPSEYQAGLTAWGVREKCKAGPANWFDTGRTVRRTTAKCADGTEVVSYLVNGMGHRWPGGTVVGLGDPNTKINAVDAMWAFFAAHPKKA
jgi:polyhydroxybutyrate depolymerase